MNENYCRTWKSGKEYDKTRHNIGWMTIDYLASVYNVEVTKSSCNCLVGQTIINGEKSCFC